MKRSKRFQADPNNAPIVMCELKENTPLQCIR
jgi:hypothetical protein